MYLGLVAPKLRVPQAASPSVVMPARRQVIPAPHHVIPVPHHVIPVPHHVIPAPHYVIPAKAGIWRPTSNADSSGRHRLDTSNGAAFPILPGIHHDRLGRRALEVKGWIPAFAGMTSGGGG